MSSSQSHPSMYSDVSYSMPYEVEDKLKESEKSSIVADREYGNIDDDGDSDEERMQQLQLRFGGSEPVMTW